jgi:uncharacterized protein DUF1761
MHGVEGVSKKIDAGFQLGSRDAQWERIRKEQGMDVHINYLAVLVAAIIGFGIGGPWYGFFSKPWMAAIGKTEAELQRGNAALAYSAAFAASFMAAYALALIIGLAQAHTLLQGMFIGLWTWVGFVAGPNLATYLFSRWPRELYLINNGYHFVSLIVMGAILGAWT